MTKRTKEDIKNLVSQMYKDKKITEIQLSAADCYYLILQNGHDHLTAIQEILSHGVEYNDILEGILKKNIG